MPQQLNTQIRLPAVSASEPVSIFVLKCLLFPLSTLATLSISLLAFEQSFKGPPTLLALIAFVGTTDLFESLAWPMKIQGALRRSLGSILPRWLLILAFTIAVVYLCGLMHRLHWGVFLSWAVATPLVLSLAHVGALRVLIRTTSQQLKPRVAVIAGVTEHGLRLEKSLLDNELCRIQVAGYFDDRNAERLAPHDAVVLGNLSQLRNFVIRNDIDIVYVTLPMTRNQRVVDFISSLHDSTASIYFVPDLGICELVQPRFDLLNGIPVVAVCETPFYGLRGTVKRLMDIAIAGAAVLFALPAIVVVAIGVKLSSPGPMIFKQRRYGLDGKEIMVYKFRSMTVTEDGVRTYSQVSRNDARVTRFGTFIRATSLDELPQLFNVLEGTMSIVGPRPHAIAVNEQYRRLIPGYMIRHKVKPGITGWAQINGYRGGDDLASMTKRIQHDVEYLRNWSLALDLSIMLRTVFIVWKDRHAY